MWFTTQSILRVWCTYFLFCSDQFSSNIKSCLFDLMMHITDDQIQQYFQDGAVLIKNAFSEEWVGKVKEGIEVSWN